MTEINLLPWREKKREQEKKQLTTIFAVVLGAAILVVFMMNYIVNSMIENQNLRNTRLQNEIRNLVRQIGEIKKLKEMKQAFVSRMTVVQNLQSTRPLTIHLFDEVLKVLPNGVHIDKIERNGNAVVLFGDATSNTNVSDLMRNIQNNQWIQMPVLTEIKKTKDDKTKDEKNKFKLGFVLKSEGHLEKETKNAKYKPK